MDEIIASRDGYSYWPEDNSDRKRAECFAGSKFRPLTDELCDPVIAANNRYQALTFVENAIPS